MIEIAGFRFDTFVSYSPSDTGVDIVIAIDESALDDEKIRAILDAKTIKEIAADLDGNESVITIYNLVAWRSIERSGRNLVFRWQTYSTTELEQLRQDNEDLTEALLELAAIVGGGENG